MKAEDYNKLQTKHKDLPTFETLDQEFAISQIDAETHQLNEIKKKIAEKLEPTIDFLSGLLNPEGLTNMFECRNMTKKDQQAILTVYQHLMEHYRYLLETDIISTDDAHADAITSITKAWLANKQALLEIISKTRCNWQKNIEPKEILEYLG
jgi:hypothetical protein